MTKLNMNNQGRTGLSKGGYKSTIITVNIICYFVNQISNLSGRNIRNKKLSRTTQSLMMGTNAEISHSPKVIDKISEQQNQDSHLLQYVCSMLTEDIVIGYVLET